MADIIKSQTTAQSYVTDLPGNGGYNVIPLLTVGDEVSLLEGEFGNFTVNPDKSFAFAGIPDGTGVFETEDYYYVFVNHELRPTAASDISSTVDGQIIGARVSVFQFDKDWNVIGGKNLIDTAVDNAGTYELNLDIGEYINTEDPDAILTFNRFCSGFLAEHGFEGGPIWFAPEESGADGRGWAVSADGTAIALEGLGRYSKENVVAASKYRADNSDTTVLFSTEDFADGEIYMFVGQQTEDDPNGFKNGDLYVLRVAGADYESEIGDSTTAQWTKVDSNVALNPDGTVLSDWVNAEDRSTNFQRPEDIHEDPNNPGTFYFVTTGTKEKPGGDPSDSSDDVTTPEEADNPYGRLYRFTLDSNDPTRPVQFDFLLEGGFGKGVSYDNIVVDSNGHVLIQEDETAFGGEVMEAEGRDARVWSYDIASGEVVPLYEIVQGAAGPEFDTGKPGAWETSGIIEIPSTASGQSSYLFDVQAHTIQDPQVLNGNYVEGGQLLIAMAGKDAISGDNGNNKLNGTKYNDTIFGDSTSFGPGGNDNIYGKAGSDRIFAGGGNDKVKGGSGDDILYGGDGDDYLRGEQGNDTISGEGGNDKLDGGKGNDKLYGGDGDDYVRGGDGHDLLKGGAGNDQLYGGKGNDKLYVGESGNDTMTGGSGKDQFWIVDTKIPSAGSTITDFHTGEDVIALGAGLAFVDLKINQLANDTLISTKEDNKALAKLIGINASTISINDFVSTAPRPLIIGHRGASGLRPEHTLASYELAIALGADYIEPDVVSTKDGVLIARHENEISGTTDVADHPEFADRKTTKIIDGREVTGWFTEDFTLAEIKTLRAEERLPFRDQSFNGQFEIPTLQEVIDLAKEKSAETGRTIGIYPETKHPTYFDSIGLSLEEPLVKILDENGYSDRNDPVFIQSFEVSNLKDLNQMTDVPLVQLFDASNAQPYDFVVDGDSRTYGDLTNPQGLAEIATYADGIGPWKRLIIPADPVDFNGDGQPDDLNGDGLISDADYILQDPTSLIEDAHAAGLLVHAYTFRNEDRYLAPEYNGNPEAEYEQFFSLGLDGLFTDFPGTGFEVATRLYPFNDPNPLAGVGLLTPTDTTAI
jgi:glycerophosphoryl diester phosphodiesterase